MGELELARFTGQYSGKEDKMDAITTRVNLIIFGNWLENRFINW
jgi:hypothetical protein